MTLIYARINILLLFLCKMETAYPWVLNEILMAGPRVGLAAINYTSNLINQDPIEAQILSSVRKGTLKAQKECQYQFEWDRWNCPTETTPFDPKFATREAAYVQAISAAGIMYSVTQHCSSGEETFCTCDKTRNGQSGGFNWKWGGCSDNIRFGDKFTGQFLKGLTSGKDPAYAAMQTQNFDAGRKAIGRNTKMVCKCHGLSGDCSVRTCWQQVTGFRDIGNYLKRRYVRAKFVNYFDGALRQGNTARTRELKTISRKHLAYLKKSPNYCKRDLSLNILGTEGRECVRSKDKKGLSIAERKSCRTLCKACGFKVRKVTAEVSTTCNCKFRWCCNVECEKCVTKQNNYFCVK